jgi:hypothetical protein
VFFSRWMTSCRWTSTTTITLAKRRRNAITTTTTTTRRHTIYQRKSARNKSRRQRRSSYDRRDVMAVKFNFFVVVVVVVVLSSSLFALIVHGRFLVFAFPSSPPLSLLLLLSYVYIVRRASIEAHRADSLRVRTGTIKRTNERQVDIRNCLCTQYIS